MGEASQLDTLEAKGLIRLAQWEPELEYLFRHWLVQDAAYGSLLKQERRQLHLLVGQSLEALYPERRAELAGILAMHFEHAGETEKAVEYLVVAGTYALERNAIREAYADFDRAASLLPPAAEEEDDAHLRRRVEIQLGRARASFSFRPYEELLGELEPVVPVAERLGDPELLAQIHAHLVLILLEGGEPATAPSVKRSLDRLTELGDELEDPSLAALPLALVALSKVFTGPIRDGVTALEQAIPLLEGRHNFIGAAFARGWLAIGYAELGEFGKADEAARNATELAASGDLIAQLDAQIAEAMVRSLRGELDRALPLARACVERSEETGATACVMVSAWVLGDIYQRQGRLEEARESLQRSVDLAGLGPKSFAPTFRAWLAANDAALGAPGSNGDWEASLEAARGLPGRLVEARVRWKRAQSALRQGDIETAFSDFEATASVFEAESARPNLARLLREWGEALREADRGPEADAVLRRALALFEEMGIAEEAAAVRATLDAA